MTAVYPCECKHPKARHQGGTYWCLTPDCTCKRYTPDFQTAEIVARAQAEPDQPALSVELRRVEQERDRLAEEVRVLKHSEAGEIVAANVRQQLAEAELASARTELEQLRYSGWIVARDGGRTCAGCGQEIRRGEAYSVDTTADVLRHVHCPEGGAT